MWDLELLTSTSAFTAERGGVGMQRGKEKENLRKFCKMNQM